MSHRWVVALIALGIVLVVAALMLWPSVVERRAPEPVGAWVGIEVEGAGVAEVGPVAVPAGTLFTLHAVVEARTRDGGTLYYTEAPALAFGGERVDGDALRRWNRRVEARVLWFTVEGAVPHLELAPGQGPERFEMVELLRTDWPYAWAVPGRLEPANDAFLALPRAGGKRRFGTQRFQVRVELWDDPDAAFPKQRLVSWGKAALPGKAAEFPTVTASLAGPAGPGSAVFGLTQIEARPGADAELRDRLAELTARKVAFARVPLVGEVLAAAGVDTGAVPWRSVGLDGEVAWGSEAAPGDLLQVGGRIVVLYRDAAPVLQGAGATPADGAGSGDGRLDRDDLVFDYARGAAVRRLADVFAGNGGRVLWAPIGGAARPGGEGAGPAEGEAGPAPDAGAPPAGEAAPGA